MQLSPALAFHIAAGNVGCFSGFVAVFLRKGSRRHARAGSVFVVAMLCLAASGTFLAILRHQPGNIVGGTLTFYLVATARATAKRRVAETSVLDWLALLVVMALAVFEVACGIKAATNPTHRVFGYPPGIFALLGSVAVLATIGDVRMLVRGGISGTQRLSRHLWRMCFAFFIAAGSSFLARAHIFPVLMQKTGTLYALTLLPLALMVFWLVRVRIVRRYRQEFAGR